MKVCFCLGGSQYIAQVGDIIYSQKIEGEEGGVVVIDKVLFYENEIGTPFIDANVELKILRQGLQKKIKVVKFIPQKHHKRTMGYRAKYTKLEVLKISKT